MEENKKEQLTPSCNRSYDTFDLVQMVLCVPECRCSVIGNRKERDFSGDGGGVALYLKRGGKSINLNFTRGVILIGICSCSLQSNFLPWTCPFELVSHPCFSGKQIGPLGLYFVP